MTLHGKTRVAFFGGAFDPPHLGHRAACTWLVENGNFDAIWIVPSYHHPYAKDMAAFEHRLALCNLQFGTLDRVLVSAIEKETGLSYTYDVLTYLRDTYAYDLTLVVGSDSYRDLHNWKNGAALTEEFRILELPRAGWTASPFPDCRSRDSRARLRAGHDEKAVVGEAVMAYIRAQHLYDT